MNNSWPRIKTCGKYSELPFLVEIITRIFSVEKYKIEIFPRIFRVHVKQICQIVRANVSTRIDIHRKCTQFACSEIENFPQRFPDDDPDEKYDF